MSPLPIQPNKKPLRRFPTHQGGATSSGVASSIIGTNEQKARHDRRHRDDRASSPTSEKQDLPLGLMEDGSGWLVCGCYRPGLAVAGFSATLVFAADEQSGNRVLEDQLGLRVVFQHDGVL